MSTCVFVPMYRCAPQITRVIAQIAAAPHGSIDRVVLIDNRSTDATAETAIEAATTQLAHIPWEILRNDANYGLGGSHKVAFAYARTHNMTNLIVLHGDDQATLSDVWPYVNSFPNAECLLGSRFMRGSRLHGYARTRIWGNRAFNILFSLTTRRHLTDLGSGLNVYNQVFLKRELERGCPDTLSFNYHLLLASAQARVQLRFFPISWREEDQRSNVKMLSQAMGMVRMLRTYVRSPKKFVQAGIQAHAHQSYPSTVIASNIASTDAL